MTRPAAPAFEQKVQNAGIFLTGDRKDGNENKCASAFAGRSESGIPALRYYCEDQREKRSGDPG